MEPSLPLLRRGVLLLALLLAGGGVLLALAGFVLVIRRGLTG